jgi:hypothetical protein
LPLSERARIEVYLPDLSRAIYQDLLTALTREFTYTFGGCTILAGLDGSYLSEAGLQVRDRINLIYTDTPYSFRRNFEIISDYADKLQASVGTALAEDEIMVAVLSAYHATGSAECAAN